MSSAVHGKFLWHELLAPDTGAAASFYSAALGWKSRPWEHDPAYSLLQASAGTLGGVRASTGGAPQWLAFVGVTDIGASVATAERLGGRVLKPVTDVSGSGGRYAVLADPQGSAIGLYQPARMQHDDGSPMDAMPALGWHELAAADGDAALGFYRELFGWQLDGSHDMGPQMGKYLLLGLGGKQFGGMYTSPDRRGWLLYFQVPSAAQAVTAVKAAGGKVLRGPMQVPGGGWVAHCVDPQGASFAVLSAAAPAAKPAATPGAAAKPAPTKPAVVAKPAAPAPAPKPAAPAAAPAAAPTVSKPVMAPTSKPAMAPASKPATPAAAVSPPLKPAAVAPVPKPAPAKPATRKQAAKPKSKAKAKSKAKPKAKTKVKAKSAVGSRTKSAVKTKAKTKAKTGVKTKAKTKAAAKARTGRAVRKKAGSRARRPARKK
ncbi:MAG TPA: VOC family protein [Steroidobacteraceae bacterium]|nr:VOC family protein [Steroidobacteraceae bacterium]